MLKLKPNCECCDIDLPPDSINARVCSFECTFCSDCSDQRFHTLCPNCGGKLVQRPIRTAKLLKKYPASTERFTKEHKECLADSYSASAD